MTRTYKVNRAACWIRTNVSLRILITSQAESTAVPRRQKNSRQKFNGFEPFKMNLSDTFINLLIEFAVMSTITRLQEAS